MKMSKKIKFMGLGICCVVLAGAVSGCTAVSATQSNQDYIGEEKAKAIALEHAGVSEGEANFVLSKFDMDDGVAEYEVEFWSESTEYDYEIDAVTGEIRSYDYDMETNVSSAQPQTQTGTESEDYIGEEKAKAIALEHAGVSEGEASYFKCEFDYDDGRAEYEIEWQIGRTEYEYTISAVDGTILERDVDQDD